ncbi:MAG TPA: CmpA/NrtA family ABC transporter substrate-binding protein [Opitutaceae bacterium]|nr:CmpA/NrtA family ABC transporter substrate-binding protein [Opitutaceae bacterium]
MLWSRRNPARIGRLGPALFAAALAVLGGRTAWAAPLPVEKTELKFGFIKLTDCAPLVIAKELGYFDDEFLSVTLEAQANWKILLDRVIGGELDGAHMLAGQPIGATIGIGTQARIITSFSMDLNGNGITVSNAIWKEMQAIDPDLAAARPPHPIGASVLRPIVDRDLAAGTPMRMGMVFPVSTHNYYLRYWLAAGGISPGYYSAGDTTGTTGAEVLLSVTPPPQMPATLEQGTIQGYCVGEPWNQQAVFKGIGVPVITDYEIWKNNPEKVFGVTEAWARKYPNTYLAVLKALIRAGMWLDASAENRRKAVEILARPEYVGADAAVIGNSMAGTFEYARGDRRPLPDFNVFFRYYATYPFYSDCIWFLTQMRRWGQIPADRPDSWYIEVAKRVYRPEFYRQAAALLAADGRPIPGGLPDTDGFKAPDSGFIDGVTYDGHHPNAYLQRFKIGLK